MAPESAEIERFIEENRLDEAAARNLRGEAPTVQRVVLDRGSLAECLNPSSALIGRIRDAKLQVKYGSSSDVGRSARAEARLGSGCTEVGLTGAAGGGGQLVMQGAGGLPSLGGYPIYGMVPNPDGSTMTMTVPANAAMLQLYNQQMQQLQMMQGMQQVPMMQQMPGMPQMMQTMQMMPQLPQANLQQGGVAQDWPDFVDHGNGGGGHGQPQGQPAQMQSDVSIDRMPMQQLLPNGEQQMSMQQLLPSGDQQVPMPQLLPGAEPQVNMNMLPQNTPTHDLLSQPVSSAPRVCTLNEVEVFIVTNRLDDTAARNLRAEAVAVQTAVIDRGTLADCVNPSSAVIGRIRDAKLQLKYGGGAGGACGVGLGGSSSHRIAAASLARDSGTSSPEPALSAEDIESFIAENRLDEAAARHLRAEPPVVQTAVINRGTLAECLNPSSAVIGRIRDAKLQVKYGHPADLRSDADQSEAVRAFIAENRLDDSAARALRGESSAVQADVVSRGSLLECTNPSSAVMGRIRDAKLQQRMGSRSGGGGGGFGAMGGALGEPARGSPY